MVDMSVMAPKVPTRAMLEAADNVAIPPFAWPNNWPQDAIDAFTAGGWAGLTRGEYDEKRFTAIYQAMIGAIDG